MGFTLYVIYPNLPLIRLWVGAQVLQFVHGIVAPLADVPVAELALQIYLQAAFSASEVARLEMIAYEFMEQVWSSLLVPK